MDPLCFAVGERQQIAWKETFDLQQRQGAVQPPFKCFLFGSMVGHFERIDRHDMLVRQEFGNGSGRVLLETVPAGLRDRAMNGFFSILEGDMADAFLWKNKGIGSEVISQIAVNQGQLPTQRVGKEGFAGTVWADNSPLLVFVEDPGCVLEDKTIAQAERG